MQRGDPTICSVQPIRDALDDNLTPSLQNAHWACDPLPSCPNYAHVNPDWLRALIAEALRVREAVTAPAESEHALIGEVGRRVCTCGWEPALGEVVQRAFDRHLLSVTPPEGGVK